MSNAVAQKIISIANEEANMLLKSANEESLQIINSAREQADEYYNKRLEKINDDVESEYQIGIGEGNTQSKKLVLKTKQAVIDEILVQVTKRLDLLNDVEFTNIFKALYYAACVTDDEEIIICEKDKKRLLLEFFDTLNISSEMRDIPSGFILVRKGVEVNSTFKAIIADNNDTFRSLIAREVF